MGTLTVDVPQSSQNRERSIEPNLKGLDYPIPWVVEVI